MRRLLCVVLLFLCFTPVFGQEVIESVNADLKNEFIAIEGAIYPEEVNGEQHRMAIIEFSISETFKTELQMFYNRFGDRNRFRTSLLTKLYLIKNRKLYLFTGPEIEFDLNRKIQDYGPPRLSFNTGLGFDFNDNVLLEARFNKQLNNTRVGPYGELGRSDVFTVGSRLKF
ncbi:MAG: hypothetical protein AB3N14_18815 [Flavobacteriaceae bacterium]